MATKKRIRLRKKEESGIRPERFGWSDPGDVVFDQPTDQAPPIAPKKDSLGD